MPAGATDAVVTVTTRLSRRRQATHTRRVRVDSRKGSGLVGLTDRVEALGGHLQIDSIAGTGTSLLAAIPFEAR
jgi:signal transduction histidine kinase